MAVRKVNIGAVKRKRKPGTKRKTTTRRRRRISGIGAVDAGGILMKVGGLGAGAVAARELNALGVSVFPSITPTMSALMQVAVGVVLPMLVKGNTFVAYMGDGMIANGVMVEAVNLGLISGMGNTKSRVTYRINGYNGGNLKTIAGFEGSGSTALKAIGQAPQRRKRTDRLY